MSIFPPLPPLLSPSKSLETGGTIGIAGSGFTTGDLSCWHLRIETKPAIQIWTT